MPNRKQPRGKATARLTPVPATPLTAIYVIPYVPWEREGFETFEVRRAELLNTLSRLHSQMETKTDGAMQSFLLGGQTVILEDIGAVRPDLLTLLVIYNAGGRLGIGPWFVSVNEALVSGESLIRNLLMARTDAFRMGLKLMTVAFSPSSTGHVAQLPQVLRGFGIDAAVIGNGAPSGDVPFRWEAPDGSSVLVVGYQNSGHQLGLTETVNEAAFRIGRQREVGSDGPFVWFFDSASASGNLTEIMPVVQRQAGIPAVQSDLRDYVLALRRGLSDTVRPSYQGELRMQTLEEDAHLWPGNLSARIYLKQENVRLQARLTGAVEPWLAVALTHGNMKHPENPRALLDHCWRMLLKNQERNALGGCSQDAVHTGNEFHFRRIDDASCEVIRSAQDALPGRVLRQSDSVDQDRTHVVVWNPHNWPVKQVVETGLTLSPGKYPQTLHTDGKEQLFSWKTAIDASQGEGVLAFLADVPAVGYTCYVVELGNTPPDVSQIPVVAKGKTVGTASGETLSIQDGVMSWHSGDEITEDLLQFHDGGDAGDTYNYCPPEEDTIVLADLIDDVKIESGPLYERLIIRHRMRVAPALTTDRKRSRGLKLIELTTTATLFDHVPGVYFSTSFTNYVKDHRLRVHINTGVRGDNVLADSAFGMIQRQAIIDGPATIAKDSVQREAISNTQPMHSIVAATDTHRSVGVMARGLPEYEVVHDDLQNVTFALTLVRSVGWLSRNDLTTRSGAVAPQVPVPDAQCLRSFVFEYGLIPTEPGDRAALLRAGREYTIPLQAYQYSTPPDRTRRSYLSVVSDKAIGDTSDGAGAILTVLKPPVSGDGWIIRLYNPHDQPVEICLTPHQRPVDVYLLTLAEEVLARISTDANGRTTLQIDPHKIVTVRMEFEKH